LFWTKEESLALIRQLAVIPVIRVSSRERVMCAVKGIMEGGLNIAEITLTVPNAIAIIQELTRTYGRSLLVGAGTVLDAESCRQALQAGAEFIVSPALDVEVVALTRQHSKVSMPGALTPTEILAAWNAGADLVKVFPCSSVGGAAYIRALRGPFPDIEFVITGGVTMESAPQLLAAGATAVGVGESVILPKALDHSDAAAIGEAARRFREALRPVSSV
jgi:2-dehydro-3-deoxyphosphogluconate aldolase / (4S)-4-hydroxy-2-oxoglutarate aldolase